MFKTIKEVMESNLSDEAKEALVQQMTGLAKTVETPAADKPKQADEAKSLLDLIDQRLEDMGLNKREAPAVNPPVYSQKKEEPTKSAEEEEAETLQKSIYIMRYGEEDSAKSAILRDAVGQNYRQMVVDQNEAFTRYLRYGERGFRTDNERKALRRQIFPFDAIVGMVRDGKSISDVKATMVEAQGDLGGYAVPPNVQSNIITRLPGLTAVRGGGAEVVTLTNANSVDAPRYSGGNDRYRGALRGAWGSETQSPAEKNATLEMVTIVANMYTFKIPMSQSLVEDASNLVSLVTSDILNTLAIDEDEAFLVGDGVGRPLGILPGNANGLSLTEVVSGNASTLTADGIKQLKRGLATQYRSGGAFVGNSDTFGVVERLKAGDGHYLFEDLSDTDRILSRGISESEAMPDVAANAYPLIFGNMMGYWIVERLGLVIERYQDSNTGINKVEYHVRRRVGGRVVKPWMFAVQKVAAS